MNTSAYLNATENRRERLALSMRVSRDVPKLVTGMGLEGGDRFYSQEREEWNGISGRRWISNGTKLETIPNDSA